MKISVKDNVILIEEAYIGVSFKTADGEELSICMRDSGFEFKYQGDMYFAKQGHVQPFNESVRGNYLVAQTPQLESDVPQSNGETSIIDGISYCYSVVDIRNAYERGMAALLDGNGHGEKADEYIKRVHNCD